MKPQPILLSLCLLLPGSLVGQAALTLPAGTPLPVSTPLSVPMRQGAPIRAELLYPVYASNTLVLPAKTILTGSITGLTPDRTLRNRARLNGDFTPFYTPIVRFDRIVLADGTSLPIVTGTATDGAPVYRIVAKPKRKGGIVRDEFDIGVDTAQKTFHYFVDPGKQERAKQLLYSQLPYHPQQIVKGTAWTVESDAPIRLVPQPEPAAALLPAKKKAAAILPASAPSTQRKSWMIQAYLREELTSATSKEGQPIHATVAEPIYNEDRSLAIPQGATIVGSITHAKPARSFGRSGALQFDFRQLVLPTGQSQNVQATIAGVDGGSAQDLAMNSEGKVQPKPQDKIVLPLLLAFLASRPLDQDRGAVHQLGKNAVASNSVGLAGFIVGTATQSPVIAAGFGAYGAALSLYDRWFHRGREVTFARDTRVVLQTTPRGDAMTKSRAR